MSIRNRPQVHIHVDPPTRQSAGSIEQERYARMFDSIEAMRRIEDPRVLAAHRTCERCRTSASRHVVRISATTSGGGLIPVALCAGCNAVHERDLYSPR